VKIYGVTPDGWVLVSYTIGNDDAKGRMGYMTDTSLLAPETVQPLAFASMPYTLASDCEGTDDPLVAKAPLMELKAGDQVTLLAFFQSDWVYVEVLHQDKLCRVFVPRSALMEE